MNLIRLLLKTSGLTVLLAMLTGFLSGTSSAGLIALINTALTSTKPTLSSLGAIFAGLCLVMLISTVISQVLLARLSEGAIFDMRIILSHRIIACPLHQLEEIGAPRLLATLTDDIQSVSKAFLGFPFLCTNIATVVSCLIYLGWLSGTVFIGLVAVMALGVGSFQFLMSKGDRFFALAREEQDRLFKHFQSLTEGIKELKLHKKRRQTFLSEDLQSTASASRHYNIIGLSLFAVAGSSGLLLLFITIGLLLLGFPQLVDVKPSVLSGYAFVIIYMVVPMEAILNAFPIFSKANIALAKIDSLHLLLAGDSLTPPQLEGTEEGEMNDPEFTTTWQHLELIGVTHTYHQELSESSFILGPIDLTFYRGELVFFIGGNGSGKSTLVKLISGLYIPETGVIQIDGQAITDTNREWYLEQFSAVFSDYYLFDRLLGLDTPDLERQSQKYLAKLQLNQKVQVKDGVLSTTTLSQGQRKRLALLTAYLENRPIYIFDEWASDQDPVFKEIFYTQLLPELKTRGKTVLVVTHDDRYFDQADRLVKLDYGQVVYDKRLHQEAHS